MKTPDGRWGGLCIEIWQTVARQLGISFEYREYGSLGPLMAALENGAIDLIPCMAAEARYEASMDLSQSFYKSGLAIAVPADAVGSRWIGVVGKILSPDILRAFGFLMLMCLTAGMILCLLEWPVNREMFGDRSLRGIGHGIWWAVVTMTSVGYGDKVPKTAAGRIVAIVWMLFSVVFIASFTANITASLTIGELRGKVRGFNDLYNVRVGAISQSEASHYLTTRGIAFSAFGTTDAGLKALAGGNVDALVLNELMLKFLVKRNFQGRIRVIPGVFDEYFVSVALRTKSELRKPINKELLGLMKTQEWSELLNRYIQTDERP